MNKTFIVSSEDVLNSYGFRVLTSGIDTSKFDKNPVGLFNHQRNDDWSTEYNGPIVQWKNLQKLKEGLQADAEFDTEDPKGKIIANKVEKGFLRGASVGIRIIETSEDPKLMLPGQKYPTVTRCELREISIVDIPANPNALALFDEDDNRIELNCEEDLMKLSAFNKTTESQVTNMFKLKLTAGLTALAAFFGLESGKEHEVELSDAQLTDLNAKVSELETLRTAKTNAEAALADANTKVTSLTSQLSDAQTTITAKDAEIARLGDLAAGAQGAGGKGAAVGADAEGAAGAKEDEFLTDTDKQVTALRETLYGKENAK